MPNWEMPSWEKRGHWNWNPQEMQVTN
jgi:hypothetical protein